MACNNCSTKFTFFHKEMGCSNCGFSFCSRCLKQKCPIPKKGPNPQHVCQQCFILLSTPTPATSTTTATPQIIYPPDIFLKRLERLEHPSAPPITMYQHYSSKPSNQLHSLSAVDQALYNRLQKLKGRYGAKTTPPPPTEQQLRQRLDQLKDGAKTVCPSNTVTEELPQQMVRSSRPEERLDGDASGGSGSSEREVAHLTQRLMDEICIENKAPKLDGTNTICEFDEDVVEEEDLPWCILCNEDAKFRCIDCDGDLYCAQCCSDAHKNWGQTDHEIVPFNASKAHKKPKE